MFINFSIKKNQLRALSIKLVIVVPDSIIPSLSDATHAHPDDWNAIFRQLFPAVCPARSLWSRDDFV